MLHAYKVREVLVFATRGTHAKLTAAPILNSGKYWSENVTEWVALRAERTPEFDHLVDNTQTEPYVYAAP